MTRPADPGSMRAMLVALTLLTGCLGSDEPETPADDGSLDTAAGEAAEDPSAILEADNGADEETMELEVEPILTSASWEGSTATSACAANTACHLVQQPEGSWTELQSLGVTGRVLRASGELTWTAATPATSELHLFLFSLDAEGMPVDVAEMSGPSPLAFDVDTSRWTERSYAFSIHSHSQAGPLFIEPSQAFSIATEIAWTG